MTTAVGFVLPCAPHRTQVTMKHIYLVAILLCSQLVAYSSCRPANFDGEWLDDDSNNREVMGSTNNDDGDEFAVAQADSNREDDGEWVDDVTGNLLVMGEDPLSQGIVGKDNNDLSLF